MKMTSSAPENVQQHESFEVELIVDHEPYNSSTIYIEFDPAVLRIDNVVPASMMQGGHALVYNDDTSGRVNVMVYVVGVAPPINSGPLVRLNFTAMSEGDTTIGFVQHPRVPNPRIEEVGIDSTPHTMTVAGVGSNTQEPNRFDATMAMFLDIAGLDEDGFMESDKFRIFAQQIHARGESADNQTALDALLIARHSAIRGM